MRCLRRQTSPAGCPESNGKRGPLFERVSIAALLDALAEAGVDVHHAASRSHDMTHADYWSTYCRQSAEEAGDLAPVAEYVDWAGYAASMRTDMVEVTVRDGQFAGSWYLRR